MSVILVLIISCPDHNKAIITQEPTCRWAADIRNQSASADRAFFWAHTREKLPPDIDPLPDLCDRIQEPGEGSAART